MEVDSIAILGNHEISHREISGESWKKAMGKPVSFTPALIRAIAAYQCLSFLLNHCQSARYSAKKKTLLVNVDIPIDTKRLKD